MLSLTLPWPPSVNRYWRHVGSRVLVSREGRAYRTLASMCIKDAPVALSAPLAGRLAVTVRAYPPDRRRRDLDNLGKALLDAITTAGVWVDDSQIDDLRIVRGEVVKGGAVTVDVVEIEWAVAA